MQAATTDMPCSLLNMEHRLVNMDNNSHNHPTVKKGKKRNGIKHFSHILLNYIDLS